MAGFKRRTLQELLNVDVNKLTLKEIQGYKKVARDEVLRGVKRWKDSEYKPPAWYSLEAKTGGKMKISFKNAKDLNKMKHQIAIAQSFLRDPTHLAKGWEEFKRKNIKILNKEIKQQRDKTGKYKQKFTEKDFDRLYKAFDKAAQIDKNVKLDKYKVMESALDVVKDESKSIDQIAKIMAENYKAIYEENEAEYQASKNNRSERMQ